MAAAATADTAALPRAGRCYLLSSSARGDSAADPAPRTVFSMPCVEGCGMGCSVRGSMPATHGRDVQRLVHIDADRRLPPASDCPGAAASAEGQLSDTGGLRSVLRFAMQLEVASK